MDHSKFTSEFKDSVLKFFCENIKPYTHVGFEWRQLTADYILLNTCLNQFKHMGLIDQFSLRHTTPRAAVIITADAIDFFNFGGFAFRDERLTKDLEKANLELEKLKAKPGLEKYIKEVSGVSSIIANLISAVGAIRG